MKKIKEKVLQAVEIVKECPENLQTICFEFLLKNYVLEEKPVFEELKGKEVIADKDLSKPLNDVDTTAKKQDDISLSDLHVKVKKFLEKGVLSLADLNQLFYKEDDKILPLYDDLKTTKTAEVQIRVSLLKSLQNAFSSGEFECQVEDVREEVKLRKAYDSNNFSNNFSNNAELFDFPNFSKEIKQFKLSEKGKTMLANILKEIQ